MKITMNTMIKRFVFSLLLVMTGAVAMAKGECEFELRLKEWADKEPELDNHEYVTKKDPRWSEDKKITGDVNFPALIAGTKQAGRSSQAIALIDGILTAGTYGKTETPRVKALRKALAELQGPVATDTIEEVPQAAAAPSKHKIEKPSATGKGGDAKDRKREEQQRREKEMADAAADAERAAEVNRQQQVLIAQLKEIFGTKEKPASLADARGAEALLRDIFNTKETENFNYVELGKEGDINLHILYPNTHLFVLNSTRFRPQDLGVTKFWEERELVSKKTDDDLTKFIDFEEFRFLLFKRTIKGQVTQTIYEVFDTVKFCQTISSHGDASGEEFQTFISSVRNLLLANDHSADKGAISKASEWWSGKNTEVIDYNKTGKSYRRFGNATYIGKILIHLQTSLMQGLGDEASKDFINENKAKWDTQEAKDYMNKKSTLGDWGLWAADKTVGASWKMVTYSWSALKGKVGALWAKMPSVWHKPSKTLSPLQTALAELRENLETAVEDQEELRDRLEDLAESL